MVGVAGEGVAGRALRFVLIRQSISEGPLVVANDDTRDNWQEGLMIIDVWGEGLYVSGSVAPVITRQGPSTDCSWAAIR